MRLYSLSKSIPIDSMDTNIGLIYGEERNRVMSCVKTLLVLFNLLCLATGSVLIYSGLSVLDVYSEHAHFTQSQSALPPTLLMIVGLLVSSLALMGIIGVLKESVCMILSFSFLLGVVFMLELSISLTGLVYQTEIRDILANSMSRAIRAYPKDPVAMEAIDTLQYQLSCCGVDNAGDWHHILSNTSSYDVTTGSSNKSSYHVIQTFPTNHSTPSSPLPSYRRVKSFVDDSKKEARYPISCCGQGLLYFQESYQCGLIQPSGCLDKLDDLIRSSGRALIMTALTVAIIQFLGIIFACSLGKLLRLQKSERERLKWEFRNHLLQTRNAANFETFVQNNQADSNKL